MKDRSILQSWISSLTVFVLLAAYAHSSKGQAYCNMLDGRGGLFEIVQVGDSLKILGGATIWSSKDGVCWTSKIHAELADAETNGWPTTMAFFDDRRGLIATTSNPDATKASIFETTDGGQSWHKIEFVNDCGLNGFFPYDLETLDETTVVMTQLFGGRMFVSNDGGATWLCLSDYRGLGGSVIAVQYADVDNWYIPVNDGLLKTSDQGKTAEMLVDIDFIELHYNERTNWLYGVQYTFGGQWVLHRSVDDFVTYESIDLQEKLGDFGIIYFITEADGILYIAASFDKLFYSLDNGDSWELTEFDDFYSLKVSKIGDDTYVSRGRMAKLGCEAQPPCDLESLEDIVIAYPNPATEVISFNTIYDKIEVIDMRGQLVGELYQSRFRREVDISHLPNGMYIFQLVSAESSIAVKVLKL